MNAVRNLWKAPWEPEETLGLPPSATSEAPSMQGWRAPGKHVRDLNKCTYQGYTCSAAAYMEDSNWQLSL